MTDLYNLLTDPTTANLELHDIKYFDELIVEYQVEYKKIIAYINQVYNYRSPFLVEEKDWGMFQRERYRANKISEDLRGDILEFRSPVVVLAIDAFLMHQKESIFQTLVAKQQLRQSMLAAVQNFSATISDKQKANELITTLDNEINDIHERMRKEQKRFGNYKGFDAVASAKAKLKINITNFVN